MGQIVSLAAKPKRCNISQLSQLGTPAAGEHILVSSDNSMTADGQGNFDCYIVGDGTTAATALELKNVETLIGVFDISSYHATGGVLAKYADLTAALNDGNNIPQSFRKGGMSVKFVQSSDNKYVQYIYTGTSTDAVDFTNTANWQKMNLEDEVSQLGQKVAEEEMQAVRFYEAAASGTMRIRHTLILEKKYYLKFTASENVITTITLRKKNGWEAEKTQDIANSYAANEGVNILSFIYSNANGKCLLFDNSSYNKISNIYIYDSVNEELGLLKENKQNKLISSENIKTINSKSIVFTNEDNLIDSEKLDNNKGIDWNGNISSVGINISVTDYIRVEGNNMICYNPYINTGNWAAGAVYGRDKNFLRIIETNQYIFADGDYYVRWCVRPTEPHANYGNILANYKPYTSNIYIPDFTEILNDSVLEVNQDTEAETQFNFVITDNRILGNTQITLKFESDDISIEQMVPVSCFVLVGGQYVSIYNGLTYINGESVLAVIPTGYTGHTIIVQTPRAKATWIETVTLKVKATFSKGLISEVNTLEHHFEEMSNMTVALFNTMSVIGDSYSCGAVYHVDGVDNGPYLNIAWGNIMARKNGLEANIFASPGLNCEKWLSSPYGKAAMLNESPTDIYFIFLGINGETLGSIEDLHNDWTQNPSSDSFYGCYGRIIGEIKQHAPCAKIVCITHYYIAADKNVAIQQIADFYNVACMHTEEDVYFKSDYYLDNISHGHPIAPTYAGMAIAFERCFSNCVSDNIDYFKVYPIATT